MDKLEKIVCEVFQVKLDKLDKNLTMKDVERWDSLTHMDLISNIESAYNIELSMDDIMNMKDIGTIYSIVESRIK